MITKARDLCSYVMVITQKSPKQYRYTFTSRLQNLSLDVIEKLYRANDTFVRKGDQSRFQKRQEFQQEAMTSLRLLTYFSQLAMEQGCILMKQYEQIAKQAYDCQNLLGAWMAGDRKRLMS